jgi:hypothetical protein
MGETLPSVEKVADAKLRWKGPTPCHEAKMRIERYRKGKNMGRIFCLTRTENPRG